jgi:hypothetical protein
MMKLATALILGSALAIAPASAQTLPTGGYPNVNKALVIAPGDTIQLLIRLVNDGRFARPPGRRLDLIYATRLPAGDVAARQAQADRAAEYFGPQAVEIGARRLSIGICDTQACGERRDPPGEWYLYERTAQGWKRVK